MTKRGMCSLRVYKGVEIEEEVGSLALELLMQRMSKRYQMLRAIVLIGIVLVGSILNAEVPFKTISLFWMVM